MASPSWTVEIAFGDAPLATAPTWVDVSAYVLHEEGITITQGRDSALSDFRTGEARFTLLNTDRRFDPLHASGPYFGDLLPNVQVRITGTASTGQVQFRGFVRGWPQTFAEGGKRAVVEVECYDGLGWLAEARASDDLVYDYAATTIGSLSAFYRQFATDWFDALDGSSSSTIVGQPVGASGPTGGSAVLFDGQTVVLANSSGLNSLSLWFRSSNTTTDSYIYGYSAPSSVSRYLILYATGVLRIGSTAFAGSEVTETAQGGWNDGRWHHFAAVATGGATWTLYVDGLERSQNVILSTGTSRVDAQFFGGTVSDITGLATPSFVGELADVATWNVDLTAAQVQGIYERSLGTYQETTTARAGRILDAVGWPSAWRDLTTTPAGVCTSPPFNGAQAVNALRDVEATEQGRLFVSKDGNVTLLGRYHTTTVTRGNTIQATFSDDGSDVGYSITSIVQDVDDVINDATVSIKLTGGSSNSSNSASITALGRKSETVNTLLPTLALAGDMAAGIVAQRKDALSRVAPVAPHFNQSTATWETLLGLRIGDRVRLEMTPSGVGSQFQQSAIIEGIRIAAGLDRTLIEFVAAPLPAATWFTVGTSTLDGTDLVCF